MGMAADMMTRPLFMAIMVTSWMCIQGRCHPGGSGVAVNCSYMPDGVTCTVDYSDVEEPEKCTVTERFLCDIHYNCSNGTGRERLSFDVGNVPEGEYTVSVRTTCGVACTFLNITLRPRQDPGKTDSSNGFDSLQGPPASLRTLWVIAGVVGVAVFIIFGILKPKRLCSRLSKLPARDTDVESNCSSSHEEPVILLDTNTDEASS